MHTRYQDVVRLGMEIREGLLRLDRSSLRARPDRNHPSIGELIASALLELDRISSQPRLGGSALPTFATDFLNRRLSRRLLDRYPPEALAAEFDRRFTAAVEHLAGHLAEPGTAPMLQRLQCALADPTGALALQDVPADERHNR